MGTGVVGLVPAWLRDDTVQLLLVLLAALLSAFASIASFVFASGTGSPTRLEVGLLVLATALLWSVAILSN